MTGRQQTLARWLAVFQAYHNQGMPCWSGALAVIEPVSPVAHRPSNGALEHADDCSDVRLSVGLAIANRLEHVLCINIRIRQWNCGYVVIPAYFCYRYRLASLH
jgi:hypothetical protein